MIRIGVFGNRHDLGQASLVYHLAWMLAERGARVLAVDLDPQAGLTRMLLSDDRLEDMWQISQRPTIYGTILPLFCGRDEIGDAHVEEIGDRIGLLAGDLALSTLEEAFSQRSINQRNIDPGSLRVTGAFAQAVTSAYTKHRSDLALIDCAPNLGPLNRAALLACDAIVIPLGTDLFSLQALRSIGPTLAQWREQSADLGRLQHGSGPAVPFGRMEPAGYIVRLSPVRVQHSAFAFGRRFASIPSEFRHAMRLPLDDAGVEVGADPNCLGLLPDYASLETFRAEARKPLFLLRPADGAFGGHQQAVLACYRDFDELARRMLARARTGSAQPAALSG